MKHLQRRCQNLREIIEQYRFELEEAKLFSMINAFDTFREEMLEQIEHIASYAPQDSVALSVMSKIKARSDKGVRAYEATMDRDDLTLLQWFYHHHEELMDGAIYAEKIIQQLESKQSEQES